MPCHPIGDRRGDEVTQLHSRCDSAPMLKVNITQSASYPFPSVGEIWQCVEAGRICYKELRSLARRASRTFHDLRSYVRSYVDFSTRQARFSALACGMILSFDRTFADRKQSV